MYCCCSIRNSGKNRQSFQGARGYPFISLQFYFKNQCSVSRDISCQARVPYPKLVRDINDPARTGGHCFQCFLPTLNDISHPEGFRAFAGKGVIKYFSINEGPPVVYFYGTFWLLARGPFPSTEFYTALAREVPLLLLR